ncbi:transmembrane amino acid transporter protein-domain-containing protein [Dichotomocladium elegans]|nr:transmembrane amino acid transporter protein-domain-containing protein [Dichotomocladium elegans]
MSSPLPANAKQNYLPPEDPEANSAEDPIATGRANSIARLSSSPARYSASPARSISSNRSYGATDMDLDNGNGLFRPLSTATYNREDGTVTVDLPEDEVARVVKRHLVHTNSPGSSVHGGGGSIHRTQSNESAGSSGSNYLSVHQLPGGAITHDIYKWAETASMENVRRTRSRSFYIPREEPSDPALAHLRDPGGFRRHYVYDQAARQGREPPHWMTRTFVDFLALYGHFSGEDLSDWEDESEEEEEENEDEETRLLHGDERAERLIRNARENQVKGTATPGKAVLLLLKSFVGTGVMFLPKAFYNGGLVFSSALLAFIACISLYSFLLLVKTRNAIPSSFGDIGDILFGKYMPLIEVLSGCNTLVPLHYLIIAQVFIFVPLAMIRRIQKLSPFALIADLFILLGLLCIYYYDFSTLSTEGMGTVEWVINVKSFPLFIGTAVFTYEGVGLVIPITESMAEPEKFPRVLGYTMVFITSIFLSVGFFSYLAYGDNVQTVILLNLPVNHFVNVVQALYALAICLSIPLQLFPAIRIVETMFFSRSGKYNPAVKWAKNGFRFFAVLICVAIAIAGSNDLDKFVSLVGALCCVPLCFLFPPLFHLKAIAKTKTEKIIDLSIITFGIVSMTYTTIITILLWSADSEGAPISRCIPPGN